MRFSKQFLLILSGGAFFIIFSDLSLRTFTRCFFLILMLLLIGDLVFGNFPRGCGYEGRWGGCLINTEVYGFPNSSASYLAIALLFFLVLNALKLTSLRLTAFLVVIISIFSLLSLSRTAWLTIVIGSIFYILLSIRNKKILAWFSFIISTLFFVFILNFESIYSLPIFDGVINKIDYYADGHEVTSGRIGIWSKTMSLISTRPFLGFGFDYFSNYVDGFDTPHQQYLEIMFKSGLVGFVIYFMICLYIVEMFVSYLSVKTGIYNRNVRVRVWLILIMPVLVNGFFQPILSYSVVSNIIMFTLGYLLEFRNRKIEI
ncbi:hypothetical protein A6E08_08835 [Vibrio lentus]|nr:hypothetical protein A6E08_08835 [Vibrio lentus]